MEVEGSNPLDAGFFHLPIIKLPRLFFESNSSDFWRFMLFSFDKCFSIEGLCC